MCSAAVKTQAVMQLFNLLVLVTRPRSPSHTYCTVFTRKLANQVLIQFSILCEVSCI